MPRVIRDDFVHHRSTVTEVAYADLSVDRLATLARAGDKGAVDALNAMPLDTLTASLATFEFDESKHPRNPKGSPEGGEFVSPGDGGGDGGTFITRIGDDQPGGQINRPAIAEAIAVAENYDPNDPYWHYDEFADYINPEGGLAKPDEWQPGSVFALSQAATDWQATFDNARDMQVAGDMLLGHFSADDEPGPQMAAEARELLTAMAGDGPEGAASGNAAMTESDMETPTIGVSQFGATELVRGMSDPFGEVLDGFQQAQNAGVPVEWSIAAFVPGGELGDRRIAFREESGEDPNESFNPETGQNEPLSADADAAHTALQYVNAGQSPVLIRTGGQGLSLDGAQEVLMGGKFWVDEIRQATRDELDAWDANDFADPITVVQLHQVENVQLPSGVSTTQSDALAASARPARLSSIYIHWRDGSLHPREHMTAALTFGVGDSLVTFDFDPEKHPRGEKGTPEGGEFIKAGDESAGTAPASRPNVKSMFDEGNRLLDLTGEPSTGELQAAKAAVAASISNGMKSSTEDIVASVLKDYGSGTTLLNGVGNHDVAYIRGLDGYLRTADTLPHEFMGSTVEAAPRIAEGIAAADKAGGSATVDGMTFWRGDSPEVLGVIRQYAVSELVGAWAKTANQNGVALGLQEAAAREFGLKDVAGAEKVGYGSDAARDAAEAVLKPPAEGVFRDFLRTQYNQTQEYLKAKGVTEVTLARGWSFRTEYGAPHWALLGASPPVKERPLASWSPSSATAAGFALMKGDYGVVTYQRVPADRILSTARTGLGALNEREFVVMGGTHNMLVADPRSVLQEASRTHSYTSTLVTFEFDETKHPRDERGRFEGGGEDSVAGRPPSGWADVTSKSDAVDGAAPVMNEAERWQTPDGQMTIRFAPEAQISDTQKTHLAETLTELHESNPLGGPLTVMVVPSLGEDYGLSVGRSVVSLSAEAFQLDPTKPGRDWTNFVNQSTPEARITRPADYVMTHEYGHAIERNRGYLDHGAPTPAAYEAIYKDPYPPSSYGNWYHHSVHEAYAEAFAEWHLSKGETRIGLVRTVAKIEGWK